MKILFATSECAPMVKTGGLGDVSAALPRALRALGHDVVTLMPAYGDMAIEGSLQRVVALPAQGSWPAAQLLQVVAPDGMPLWLLSCPALFASASTPYGDPAQQSLQEQALRFGLLSRVAAWLGTPHNPSGWHADIVHANDWPSALAPLYLRQARAAQPGVARSLITVHNLAFQGLFPLQACNVLDIPEALRGIEGVEFWGQLSMLKAGLQFADAITTVSPTYAREIQEPALGCGLDGVLRSHADRLHGILNGIDTSVWNPATDALLAARYHADDLSGKALNRAHLRQRCGLSASAGPLLGCVGRLTTQKGIDVIVAAAPRMLREGAQLVVLGKGDPVLEEALVTLAHRHPGQVHVTLGFDETLAHQIEAGADCFLMPSRFEPCGLNQMYSQAYGTPPLVTATGGLADTVSDVGPELDGGTGFVMAACTEGDFNLAVDRMLKAWSQPAAWRQIQLRGMRKDFGWEAAARRYEALAMGLLQPAGAQGPQTRSKTTEERNQRTP